MKKTIFKNLTIKLSSGLFVFLCLLSLSQSSLEAATTTENLGIEAKRSYKKKVIIKNTGSCAIDVYKVSRRQHCVFRTTIQAGTAVALWEYTYTKLRFVNHGAQNFNNLEFDKWYKVGHYYQQIVKVNPNHCGSPGGPSNNCANFIVDAGNDIEKCDEETTQLTASVTGQSSCATQAESDCNHTLYQSGGYQTYYYPHKNAAYCGNGKGAKLWTRGGRGTSFVTIDFGKVVPAGTKIHTRMKLEHCGNFGSVVSSARIEASTSGSNGFIALNNDLRFSSTYYKEYTYTLSSAARFVRVVDNGACSFLVDYVRYEIPATSNDAITYNWSGPGIIGTSTTATISVNKAGTYTVTATDCSGSCTATDTVTINITTPITDAGTIEASQIDCEAFTPALFTGTDIDATDAGTITYQWQVKAENSRLWRNIPRANDVDYQAPNISSGKLLYRRGVKGEKCGEFIYSNEVSVEVLAAPSAEITSEDADCEGTSGSIALTFADAIDQEYIEISIDGGQTYTRVADAVGSFSFDDLAADTYDVWVQWIDGVCPVNLGTITIDQKEPIAVDLGPDTATCAGEEVILTAAVQGQGTCEECVEYAIDNTDYCRGDHDFVAWLKASDGQRRWFSNVDLVWKELPNGTATLTGKMYDYFFSKTYFEVNAVYAGKTTIAPAESPKEHFCNDENASGWVYYTDLTGTVTQIGGDFSFNLSVRGAAFQVGNGANVYETTSNTYGASGWFDMSGAHTGIGDFNINFGDCITKQNTGVSYLWSTGETTQSITVAPEATTTYSVSVANCAGCVATDDITVAVNDYTVDAGSDQSITDGDSATLTASAIDADSYTWSNGATGASITVTPTETTTYTVTATKGGCEATDTVTVTVNPIVGSKAAMANQIAISPNPVRSSDIMTLAITVAKDQEVSYQIYALDGSTAQTNSITVSAQKGDNTVAIDLNRFNVQSNKIYIIKVIGSDWAEHIQFLTL